MSFQLKPTKHKVSTVYKSLYIREELAKQVEQVTHADVVAVAQMLALDTIYYLTGEEG